MAFGSFHQDDEYMEKKREERKRKLREDSYRPFGKDKPYHINHWFIYRPCYKYGFKNFMITRIIVLLFIFTVAIASISYGISRFVNKTNYEYTLYEIVEKSEMKTDYYGDYYTYKFKWEYNNIEYTTIFDDIYDEPIGYTDYFYVLKSDPNEFEFNDPAGEVAYFLVIVGALISAAGIFFVISLTKSKFTDDENKDNLDDELNSDLN